MEFSCLTKLTGNDFMDDPINEEKYNFNNLDETKLSSPTLNTNININDKHKECPEPSSLRISTMTATCETNMIVDLNVISNNVDIKDYYGKEDGVIKVIFGEKKRGMCKKDIDNKKTKGKKNFYNQATLIVRINSNSDAKEVNVKIFNNGNLQMTGLKSEENGKKVIHTLYNELEKTKEIIDGVEKKGVSHVGEFSFNKFQIQLINSDFSANFKIKRDVLNDLIISQYNIFSTFEPCIYPGVNTKYYWNKTSNNSNGVCMCSKTCNGKGNGYGDGKCKKITIAIFQSGNIIITGARNTEQINDTYKFITELLKKHYNSLKRNYIPLLDDNEEINVVLQKKSTKRIYLLPRSKVKIMK